MLRSFDRKRAAAALLLLRKKRSRCYWVRPFNQSREEKGEFTQIVKELQLKDDEWFYRYTRMDFNSFQRLVNLLTPAIQRQDTNFRKSVSPEELRILAHGESMGILATNYNLPCSLIATLIFACSECEGSFT